MAYAWFPRYLEQLVRLYLPGNSPLLQLLALGDADYRYRHELQCAGHRLRCVLQHVVLHFLGEEVLFRANSGDQQQVDGNVLRLLAALRILAYRF